MSGYHIKEIITRGVLGESSKVREELEEYEEAKSQMNEILMHCELADLYGALEALALNHRLNMNDLRLMSEATKRAFKDGSRK